MPVLLIAVLLMATSVQASDSAEAARVAAWVRALPAVDPDHAHFNALGSISFTHIGPESDFVRHNGPAAFYDDTGQIAQARNLLDSRTASYVSKLPQAGICWFRDVQNVPWGMIEVQPGRYQFEILDTIVQDAQSAGGRYVGTVMPYAGWELKAAGYPATSDAQCQRLFTEDVFYLAFDQRMDRYKDEAAYLRFLGKVVERYDGDGIDDMPGVTAPIRYWQIHNEPEGDHCGLFRNDAAAFARLMKISADLIHGSCAACKVLNGGAGIPLYREDEVPPPGGTTFWREFAAAGGADSVDIIAIHYNEGKGSSHGKIEDFESQISKARKYMGANKPVWVTEFGVVIGNHGLFVGLTEPQAAAWFIRFYAAGFAAGAEKFFSDAPAFIDIDGTNQLPLYVNKLLEAKLGGFSSAAKIATGQYRFSVGGRDVWVIWNGVPGALTGSVVATDMYGNETTLDASSLSISEAVPLIVTKPAIRRRPAR